VFPYEELYARFYFLCIQALDAYSNTPHEGTNAGAKHCEKWVLPSMSQTESTETLTEQDQERGKDKRRKVADSIHKTQLHSSNSTTGGSGIWLLQKLKTLQNSTDPYIIRNLQ
jgi:hypothetical protein